MRKFFVSLAPSDRLYLRNRFHSRRIGCRAHTQIAGWVSSDSVGSGLQSLAGHPRAQGRRDMRFKPRTGAALAAFVALALGARVNAGTAATYLGTTGSNWTDVSHWSTNPFYPDNGNPAGATYDVTINSGAQIQVDKDITVDNVTF